MNTPRPFLRYGAAVVFLLVLIVPAHSQPIKKKNVPRAVLAACWADYPGATVRSYEGVTVDKNRCYKITCTWQTERTVIYDSKGRIVRSSEEINTRTLPYTVRHEIHSSYPHARLVTAHKIKAAEAVRYSATIRQKDSTTELLFDHNGARIGRERMTSEDLAAR